MSTVSSSKPPSDKHSSEAIVNTPSTYVDISTLGPSSPDEDKGWQNDMLLALQQNATPEPIRLACMKHLPSRPPFFGEEFHGRIPREEVEALLTGGNGPVNGRYLVRESNSSPGSYSLSLSYGGSISHFHLYYENERYSIGDEKRYESITDLVVDVLNMCRVINYADGQMPEKHSERKKSSSRPSPHAFKPHSYKHPKWCALCGNFMWGIRDQGMRCVDCGLDVHNRCMRHVGEGCKKEQPKKLPRKKISASSPPPIQNSVCSDTFKATCEYQEDCIRFLSYLNIPSQYFDVDAMNPCYCDDCCLDVDTPLCKSGNPPKMYSLPTGWCRFQLHSATVANQNDIVASTWNLAFLSLNPEEVVQTLNSKFSEDNSDGLTPEGPRPLMKLTPSIICADLDSPKLKYTDSDTRVKAGQVVLQAYIEPYSYQMMGRPGSTEEIDPYFKKDTIYWVTKQTGSIIPFALLVKTMEATYLQL